MEPILAIQQALLDWLRGQSFTPALRSLGITNQPVAAYPHLTLSLTEEAFWPGQADATARLQLELCAAAGRVRDARSAAISLAHQVKRALAASHGLGGLARKIAVERISYQQLEAEPGCPVLEQATVVALVRYAAAEL